MKIVVSLLTILSVIEIANAALPPQYQNMKDLDVMVGYVRKHPSISAQLKSINLRERAIYYGNNCKALFGRKSSTKPPGWVGPAEDLEFKSSNCSVD